MELILYTFSKKRNSTARPTGTGTAYDVYLKDGTSVESPVFLIDGVNLAFNYAKWNDHYYFIDDIVLSLNNIYEIHCSHDVLATFKTEIGNSTQFVERSASSNDPMINDVLVTQQQDVAQVKEATTTISGQNASISPTPGTYLIQTFGRSGVHLYGFSDLNQILGILNNDAYGMTNNQLEGLIQTIGMNLLDVSAYVSNVRWVPFDLATFNGSVNYIEVSFWVLDKGTGFQAKEISDRSLSISGTINKPVNLYDDFRSQSPRFTNYMLYLPGVGTVSLNALDVEAYTLSYTMNFDIFTGEVMYFLYAQLGLDRHIIGSYSGKLACEIPYSSSRTDVWSIVDTLTGISGGASQGMSGAAGIGLAVGQAEVKAVENVLNPSHSFNSAVGNISKIRAFPDIRLSVANYGSKDFLTAVAGRPLYEWRVINTLSGFVKCSNPSIDIAGYSGDKDAVNGYLASGFYYE